MQHILEDYECLSNQVRQQDLFHNTLKAKNMGLIKEPKNVDFSTKSEPWTEQELVDLRKIMQNIKAKNAKRKERTLRLRAKKKQLFWQARTAKHDVAAMLAYE